MRVMKSGRESVMDADQPDDSNFEICIICGYIDRLEDASESNTGIILMWCQHILRARHEVQEVRICDYC